MDWGAAKKKAYPEVGGVEEAEFVRGTLAQEKHSADFGRRQTVEEFAGTAPAADTSDVDGNGACLVGDVASPEEASGHEFGAAALGLPRVAVVDLGGALADRLAELAVDGPDGVVAQLEIELALRKIGVRAHGLSSVAEGRGPE